MTIPIPISDHCRNITFNFFIGESKTMPQTVQISITLTIKPATVVPPIVATPPAVTLPDQTVGIPVPTAPVAVVSGGVPPFSQPVLDPASPNPIPPGLTAAIDAAGNVTLAGVPSAPGSGTFILDVKDSSA